MQPERWHLIDRLCQTALEMEPGRRQAYLREACAGDVSLRREVEALLAHQSEAESFMKNPAMNVAAKALAEEQQFAPAQDLIGRTIIHYRIVEEIGQGGMGEVFLAEDTSLGRKVALKFLSPGMYQDTVARKRLLREAHSAAALDHPYICHINEIAESEGKDFIVMEYVDGQTLKDRLALGSMPLREAMQIASEVAEALEEAHQKRIIHRDLKPANIMLTRKDHAKVMDFGLAKRLISQEGTGVQDQSVTSLTYAGMTLGTLAYMSPEQLRGQTVDARSDIFSFGVVLYEMLVGVHPFKKETRMDTASAILNDDPRPLEELRPDVPVFCRHIVKKMLAKDPQDRYLSTHDVWLDLRELIEEPNRPPQRKGGRLNRFYVVAAGALMLAGAGTWAFLRFVPRERELPPPRFVPVTTFSGLVGNPSISPDGNWIAFRWNGEKQDNWDIYVRELDGPGFNRLTTNPASDCCAEWSPDGRQIAFARLSSNRWTLYIISPLGGGERKVIELGGYSSLSWSPDGRNLAFSERKSPKDPWSIWSLSLETLVKTQVTTPDAGIVGDTGPAFSPDGRYLAFIRGFEVMRPALYVMQLPRGEPRLVTGNNSPLTPCWTADSREIVFASHRGTGEGALWRVSVGGGNPRRVPTRGEGVGAPHVRRNRLAYVSQNNNSDIWKLELTGPEALKSPSKPVFSWTSLEADHRISPDGRRIAFLSDSSGSQEIWVSNADGARPMKLTEMRAGSTGSPYWSPDGRNIAFDSTKAGNSDIYVVGAEGGPVRRITTDSTEDAVPSWSRDGRWIYFGSNRGGSWRIWKVPQEGGKAIQVTRGGGLWALETSDGYVYYHGYYQMQQRGIWRVPRSGGAEALVVDREIRPQSWDVTDRGIYFIDVRSKPASLCFYDFTTKATSSVASFNSDPAFGINDFLSVSPDGKWLLYSGGIYASHIMMIDNFR